MMIRDNPAQQLGHLTAVEDSSLLLTLFVHVFP